MKNYIKSLLVLCFLSIASMASAFPADPDPTVDPPAPIDGYVIGFMIVGLALACWKFSKRVAKA